MDFRARQTKLREHLATTRFDALLISHLPNIRYLCGFTGSAGLLLVEEARSIFFTDVRYDTQAHEEIKAAKVVIARKALLAGLGECLGGRRKRSRGWTVGIEAEHFTVAEKKRLTQLLPSGVRLKDAPSVVERARMVKDADELNRIRAAVALGATLFDRALEVLRSGSERDRGRRRNGVCGAPTVVPQEMSFPTIIASGARSALPHGRASDQPIAPGGFVVCDFGVILAGYCSDQTRTVWVGPVPVDARRAYEAVRESQQAAIDAVRPGVPVGAVDDAARKVLRKARFGTLFYPLHRAWSGT